MKNFFLALALMLAAALPAMAGEYLVFPSDQNITNTVIVTDTPPADGRIWILWVVQDGDRVAVNYTRSGDTVTYTPPIPPIPPPQPDVAGFLLAIRTDVNLTLTTKMWLAANLLGLFQSDFMAGPMAAELVQADWANAITVYGPGGSGQLTTDIQNELLELAAEHNIPLVP